MIKPTRAPPMCAKCAIFPTEYLVIPKNKSPKSSIGIKYFAAIGIGKKIIANFASLKYKPNATKTP